MNAFLDLCLSSLFLLLAYPPPPPLPTERPQLPTRHGWSDEEFILFYFCHCSFNGAVKTHSIAQFEVNCHSLNSDTRTTQKRSERTDSVNQDSHYSSQDLTPVPAKYEGHRLNPDVQQVNLVCPYHHDRSTRWRSWLPIPVAERSWARVCGRSLAGIAGSNPAVDMNICVLCCTVRTKGKARTNKYR